MNVSTLRPLGAALVLGTALESTTARAGSRGADEALAEFRDGSQPHNVVENRFFLKRDRWEVAPTLGYVPNNPFVKRYVGGVMIARHFTEELAAEATVMYAPDLGENDLKDLTSTLVQIAETTETGGEGGSNFQQPLDKMILGATFDVRWAPVYGKLNLIGERVLNFDFYGTAGLGLMSSELYYAQYDESSENFVSIQDVGSRAHANVNVGVGFNFFLSSSVALKLDGRSYLYIDKKPDYDVTAGSDVTESRLYNNFVATLGLGFYFPSMGERLQF
jgi:outer membrane beta-barrel protein